DASCRGGVEWKLATGLHVHAQGATALLGGEADRILADHLTENDGFVRRGVEPAHDRLGDTADEVAARAGDEASNRWTQRVELSVAGTDEEAFGLKHSD